MSHGVRPPIKWKKLGRIFDPPASSCRMDACNSRSRRRHWYSTDFVRIYFSSRELRSGQRQVPEPCLLRRFAKDFRAGHPRESRQAVIELGKLGCFDEHGIFPMNVVRHNGDIYGYTCGWSRRVSVSVETAVGLAFSDDDGLTFRRHRRRPGPRVVAA